MAAALCRSAMANESSDREWDEEDDDVEDEAEDDADEEDNDVNDGRECDRENTCKLNELNIYIYTRARQSIERAPFSSRPTAFS